MDKELSDYLLARSVMGRKIETEQTNRLMSAQESIDKTRKVINRGRGNVREDIQKTGGQATWAMWSSRTISNELVYADHRFRPTNSETMGLAKAVAALKVRAGNCSEHADLLAHIDAKEVQRDDKESIHRVSGNNDHAWADRRDLDGKVRKKDIIMDAWAKGSAIEREDSYFANKKKYFQDKYSFSKNHTATDPHTIDVSQKLVRKSDKRFEKEQLLNSQLEKGKVFSETHVLSPEFREKADLAMQRLGTRTYRQTDSKDWIAGLERKGFTHTEAVSTAKEQRRHAKANQDKYHNLLMDIHKVGVQRTAGIKVLKKRKQEK